MCVSCLLHLVLGLEKQTGSKHQIKVVNETMDCDKIIEGVQRGKRGRTKHRNLGMDRPSGTLESHRKERCQN